VPKDGVFLGNGSPKTNKERKIVKKRQSMQIPALSLTERAFAVSKCNEP
jgi:hypothetical protein